MLMLAQQMVEVTQQDIKEGYGGLIFMGCFFIALILAGIWWLKRSA